MITITITKEQADFLIHILEKTGHEIKDDPEAFGFQEEEYHDDDGDLEVERLEEDLAAFKKKMCTDVIDKLTQI